MKVIHFFSAFALVTFLTLGISGCSSNFKENRAPFKESPIDKAYSTIRPQIQSYTITGDSTCRIIANEGTEVLIPKNTFVNQNGEVVLGNIQIKVLEAFTLKDFISSGLVTLSGDDLLRSKGMIFIDAKSEDESLEIKPGNELIISMPTIGSNKNYQMFNGDGQNWKVDSSMIKKEEYLIPLPLDLLYPEGYDHLIYCTQTSGYNIIDSIYRMDSAKIPLIESEFENTYVATKAFRSRFWPIRRMTTMMSLFVDRDYYFDKHGSGCTGRKTNYELWNLYFQSAKNKSLWETDSIAEQIFRSYFEKNKEELAKFCNEVNEHKWANRAYKPSRYHFDFRDETMEEWYISALETMPSKTQLKVRKYENMGINLNSSTAHDELKSRGLNEQEILSLLTFHFKRETIIKSLKRQQQLQKIYSTTIFSTTSLGWLNLDKFYLKSDLETTKITLRNSSVNNLNFIDFSLVLPDFNVKLSSSSNEDGSYSFRKGKLPHGKEAIIIGVSELEGSIYFASKKIIIKDSLNINFDMQKIPDGTLGDSLEISLKL